MLTPEFAKRDPMTDADTKTGFTDEEIAQTSHNLIASISRIESDKVPYWHELEKDAWQREDTFRQINMVRENPEFTAEQDHEKWRAVRLASGWTHGPHRDDATMQNPLLVPWEELPFVFRARSLAAFHLIRIMLGLE